MEVGIAPEKDPARKKFENSISGWQINVLRSRLLVGQLQEDIATGQADEVDKALAEELTRLIGYVKPTYDSQADISEVARDLTKSEGGPSWWSKLAVAAHAFGVEISHQPGTPESPTAHDVLSAMADSAEQVLAKGVASEHEDLTALRGMLMKLSHGLEYYPADLWR